MAALSFLVRQRKSLIFRTGYSSAVRSFAHFARPDLTVPTRQNVGTAFCMCRPIPDMLLRWNSDGRIGNPAVATQPSMIHPVLNFYHNYGFTALVFHSTVSAVSLASWWALASRGIDIPGLLGQLGVLSPLALLVTRSAELFGAGSFAIAYAIHKLTGPLRLLFTIVATPLLIRRFGSRQAQKMVQKKKQVT